MSLYKVKIEDKAAFLNRLEKLDVPVNSNKIKDNKLEGYFEVELTDPEQIKVAKTFLKAPPKVNDLPAKKNNLKEMLRKLVREELHK